MSARGRVCCVVRNAAVFQPLWKCPDASSRDDWRREMGRNQAYRENRDHRERERRVLELRYGFGNGDGHTLQEVADRLHISRERVNQLEKQALNRLRRWRRWMRPPRVAA